MPYVTQIHREFELFRRLLRVWVPATECLFIECSRREISRGWGKQKREGVSLDQHLVFNGTFDRNLHHGLYCPHVFVTDDKKIVGIEKIPSTRVKQETALKAEGIARVCLIKNNNHMTFHEKK